jgi:hypothetical protein
LPVDVDSCDAEAHGTTIKLTHLNQNLAVPSSERLKQLLILEYGRQSNFNVFVNGELLAIEDIPGESFVETFDVAGIGAVKLRYTIAEAKALKQSGIAIRVNGKVVGSTTYFGLENEELIPNKLLKRVYGEVEADGLSDHVTADWGAIIENSEAYRQISECVQCLIKNSLESTYSHEISLAKARLTKEIYSRLERIPEYRRDFARIKLERVMHKFYGESIERIRPIVDVTLEAFETDEYWAIIQKVNDAKRGDVETFAEALESFGIVDMAIMAQQARRRLQILDYIDDLASNDDTLEKTIHTALEKNLWILGTQYSLMSSNETTAKVIKNHCDKEFSGERANKRPDLLLTVNLDGKHLLIEFKRPSHSLTRDDKNQAEKYRDDLTNDIGIMDIIVMGGSRHRDFPPTYDQSSNGIQILSYKTVISNARRQLEWLLQQLTTEMITE